MSFIKFLTFVFLLLLAALDSVNAQHHNHLHHHNKPVPSHIHQMLKKVKEDSSQTTTVVFFLDGKPISKHEVLEGIKNGTLTLDKPHIPLSASSAPAMSTGLPLELGSCSSAVIMSYSMSGHSSEPAKPSAAAVPTSSLSCWPLPSPGVETEFPDGKIDCSSFPSEYGAINIDWLNLGGWIGIQHPLTVAAGGFSNIETIVPSLCSGPDCCGEGMYCSYACPVGYQKSQWPTMQGSTGQSVGGLLCQKGKLHLTNPALSKNLCVEGSIAVPVLVQNKMTQSVAVCRTDYPGTEGETIPLNAAPGSSTNLTCPDAANYYMWQGLHTSAQYYVNPAGVSVQDACQWGSSANSWGNFAPLNLGVGYSGGSAWVSIFQNAPTTNAKLDFAVEIVGDNGGYDNLVGRCKYENGQYCSGEGYTSCDDTGNGCTVSASYGSVSFVFF